MRTEQGGVRLILIFDKESTSLDKEEMLTVLSITAFSPIGIGEFIWGIEAAVWFSLSKDFIKYIVINKFVNHTYRNRDNEALSYTMLYKYYQLNKISFKW